MFSCEFCENFKNSFLTEHLRVTASDIPMQLVVIYNLNPSLQIVTINFTLLWVFILAHASISSELLHGIFL